MINSITFKKDFRTFNAGDRFEFKPGVNVLVGDQGSGKSTLIELLRIFMESSGIQDDSWRAKHIQAKDVKDVVELSCSQGHQAIGFDFERERLNDSVCLLDDIGAQMAAMRSSHGEGNMIALDKLIKKIKVSKANTILMDEPDTAMSPRSCYNLILIMDGLVKGWQRQVIVAAHNPIIINGIHPVLVEDQRVLWNEVLSIEHKKWMSGSTFIITQLASKRKKEKENEQPK